jgi:hypothetical protein
MQMIIVGLLTVLLLIEIYNLLTNKETSRERNQAKEIQILKAKNNDACERIEAAEGRTIEYMLLLKGISRDRAHVDEIRKKLFEKCKSLQAENNNRKEDQAAMERALDWIAESLGLAKPTTATEATEAVGMIFAEIQKLTTEPEYRGAFKAIAEQQRDKIAAMTTIVTRQAPHDSRCTATGTKPCNCWKNDFAEAVKV